MMTRRSDSFVLTLLMAMALMAGCGKGSLLPQLGEDGRGLPQALVLADSLMNSRPDSALAVLEGAEGEMAGESKSVRMRYQLLRHQAMNKAFVPFTSDSLMIDVADYYDSHGTANERMLAHYLLGCVYRDLKEGPHAIDCFQKAIANADTTSEDCNFRVLSSVYSQMARVFHQQLLLSYEVEARRQSGHYATIVGDTLIAISELNMSANAYILMNKQDSSEILLHKAIRQYMKCNRIREALLASTSLMYLYIDKPQHLSDLKQLIDQYEEKSGLFDEHHDLPPSKRIFYYYKGKYFEGTNRLDSAEFYYRKMFRPNMSFSSLDPMYRGLLSVFSKRHQADSIAKYSQLYCEVNDSSIAIKDQDLTAQLAASYDYHYYKEQSLENENKALWALFAFIVTLIILTILIIGFVYLVKRFHKTQIRLRRIHYAREEELLRIHEQEKDKLQQAYYQSQKQAKLEYEQKLTQLKLRQEEELTASRKKELSRKYFNHDVVLRSIRIANDPRQFLTEKAFDDLLTVTYEHFPVVQQEFEQAKDLKPQMKRVCILSILDIHVDDIGRLMKVSPQRITNLRADLSLILFNKKSARHFESNLRKHFGIKKV